MNDPKPLPRTYDDFEVWAFRRISRRMWNQKYEHGRGPAWFGTGTFWAEEMRRQARRSERDAIAFRTAAIALEREEPKR